MGKMFWVVSVCLFQLVVYTAAQTSGESNLAPGTICCQNILHSTAFSYHQITLKFVVSLMLNCSSSPFLLALPSPLLHPSLLSPPSPPLGLMVQSVPPVIGGDMVKTKLKEIVSLTCESAASEEAATELEWLRNGVQVSLAEGNKLGRSSLCVSPVTLEDHAAIFTCQLKGNASVNASVTLDITCESPSRSSPRSNTVPWVCLI